MPQQNPNSPPWPSLNKENSNYTISPILLNNIPPFNGKSKDSFPFHTDPSLHYYCNREYELSPEQLRKTKNISNVIKVLHIFHRQNIEEKLHEPKFTGRFPKYLVQSTLINY